jgi:hypothetical protein
MGISLTGLTPATTYDALIKVGDNGPIDATLKVLSDGLGTNLPMEASTTGVNFTGTTTVSGVAVANTTQLATKQDTLVSGTNIKTINSTSILGSGNISVVTSPSGVSGAIQFSNGSAFASDATNLFWDDTNDRLGVGTNTPLYGLDVSQNINGNIFARLQNTNAGGFGMLLNAGDGVSAYSLQWANYLGSGGGRIYPNGVYIGQQSSPTARLQVQGSGSTSATTSLLVQNSAGTATLTARDDGKILIRDYIAGVGENAYLRLNNSNGFEGGYNEGSGGSFQAGGSTVNLNIGGSKILQGYSGGISIGKGASNPVASAQLEVFSTTKGFLPPVMTTTQKNAIASPAAGLVVYDSTTNKLQCYNGSTWNDLF